MDIHIKKLKQFMFIGVYNFIPKMVFKRYHRDKEMIKYAVNCIVRTVPSHVEIVVVGNNYSAEELDVSFPYANVKYYKVKENLFYREP
jgi:hypothetical protein